MIFDDLTSLVLSNPEDTSLNERLQSLVKIVRKHLAMEVAFISKFESGERVIKYIDKTKEHAEIDVKSSDPLEESYCQLIADGRLDQIIPDAHKNPTTREMAVTDRLSIGSYLGVPLTRSDGSLYGTLCCYKEQTDLSFNERDISFLEAISEIASSTIEEREAKNVSKNIIVNKINQVLEQDKLTMHYQPIYDINTKQLKGFESLARFSTEPYRPPNIWFSEAKSVGMSQRLEIAAVISAISNIDAFHSNNYISVNISPENITNGTLVSALKDVDLTRVVLEITEHDRVDNYQELSNALAPLRDLGIRLAIDDAGAGYSSLQHILKLNPDIIKLDISLTRDIYKDDRKYALAHALCAFANDIDCTIIAEGVETKDDYDILKNLGVDKVQGYYMGKPMPLHDAISLSAHS